MKPELAHFRLIPLLAAICIVLTPTNLHGQQAAGAQNPQPQAQVAANAGAPAPAAPSTAPAPMTNPSALAALWVGLVILLLLFLVLAARTDILRDAPSVKGQKRFSFSLARTQMAWWFFIVLASYLYIWVLKGDYKSLNQTALILIGISSGTGALCYVIDANRRDKRQGLAQQQQDLNAQSAAVGAQIAAAPETASADDLKAQKRDADSQLALVSKQLDSMASEPDESEGFVYDILRDETGISLHRFQMVVWTVALGVVFVSNVMKAGAMPEFNEALLGLMGISSGTYIGFKIPDPPK